MSIIEKAIAKLNQYAEYGNKQQSSHITDDNASRVRDNAKQSIQNPAVNSIRTGASSEVEIISTSNKINFAHDAPSLADEFRRIKRPLLSNAFGKQSSLVVDGNVVMVTSSLPGEGKSFTAANLAISMASEEDFTVLLVDADVAMSNLTKMFGLEKSLGLTDLISDSKIDISEAIFKTNYSCLSVIPAGHKNLHAAELLGSESMADIVQELANRYKNRMIIFDSPPLLVTTESVILSEKMGQIVFVVEANKTPQSAVLESISMLNKDKPINLILNKIFKSFNHGQYGGYYSYGENSSE